MDFIVIVLRILHIFSAVAWVGGVWLFVFFVEPTVATLGPDAGKFMNYLVTVRKYPIYLTAAAGTTILAGLILFGIKWGSLLGSGNSAAITFLIGGILGIIAGAIGGMTGATAGRMIALGGEIAKQGKPPSKEQLAQIGALQARLRQLGLYTAIITSLALLCMAVARYIPSLLG
jgi:uncharacterized membrane protein